MENTMYTTIESLTKAALFGQPLRLPEPEDWKKVYEELCIHHVDGLFVGLVPTLPLPADLSASWQAAALRQVNEYFRYLREQRDLIALLRDAAIPMVVLKGYSVAALYPHPEYRSMGDVDFIVKPECFDRADKLLRQNGYTFHREPENNGFAPGRHYSYTKNGFAFEMHRYFACLNDPQMAKTMDALIFDGIDAAQLQPSEFGDVPVLPPIPNGIVLLQHLNQHMQTGIGLRQLFDWLIYVNTQLDDETWNADFAPVARSVGLETLAIAAARVGQLYFGLNPAIRFCADADDALCDFLRRYIMTCGNFGVKKGKADNVVVTLMKKRGIGGVVRDLQKDGLAGWGAAKRHPILRPFAWGYQLYRYAYHWKHDRVSVRAFRQYHSYADQVQDMCDKLGVLQWGGNINGKE